MSLPLELSHRHTAQGAMHRVCRGAFVPGRKGEQESTSTSLTILIIVVGVIHLAAFAVMVWIRVRRDEGKGATGESITPCAVCGAPAIQWSYDGLDPDEQRDPHTGRAYSLDTAHYQPVCAAHAPQPTATGQRPVKIS
jgi:hypothetical protein